MVIIIFLKKYSFKGCKKKKAKLRSYVLQRKKQIEPGMVNTLMITVIGKQRKAGYTTWAT